MTGYDIAKTHLGEQENKDNARLRKFFKDNSIKNDLDIDPVKYAWCAVFVNACERAAGNKGNGKWNARSFLTYGRPVKEDDAKEGDIMIFERGKNPLEGHVTYFVSWDDDKDTAVCLGGNQHDMVNYSEYSQDRIIGIRRA